MRPARFAIVLGFVAAILAGGPAWGHATFSEGEAVAGSEEEVLEMNVPVEQEGHNQKVVVALPETFEPVYCYAEVGWSCTSEPAQPGVAASFTFVRTSAPPTDVDAVSFAVNVPDERGDYPFPVAQVYSTGAEVVWDDPLGGPEPAPVLHVVKG